MHSLPLLISLLCAAALAPALLRHLADSAHTRPNYRGRQLPCPFGVLTLAAALVALIPLMLIQQLGSQELFYPVQLTVAVYALGVLALGLVDDTLAHRPAEAAHAADAPPPQRGWRGHGAALLRGQFSTGALKAAGSLGLALLAIGHLGLSNGRWLLASAVLVLATNVFNLLDLRPGRATKAFVALGGALALGSWQLRTLWALGLFAGPALVAGAYDLRERAMLGDTGANLLGALAGLWLVLTLSGGEQLVALALLVAITLYGEIRSISGLVERTPGLRQLDSWGRPS
jgi:UDP-GlcNAc:undecaprenyl-phosphate GlcNAc-1-phosphate transferase